MTHKKVGLYIISLGLLFVFVIVIKIEVPVCFGESCEFIGFKNLITKNIIPIICFMFLIWGLFEYYRFRYDLRGTTDIPFQIKKIESVNYEHLTFLATYVIPLVGFDFDSTRYLIVLGVLLVVMGVIYVKTDLFYANPSLALLGFHIYKVDGNFKGNENRNDLILITMNKLSKDDRVSYIKLDERIFYAVKAK